MIGEAIMNIGEIYSRGLISVTCSAPLSEAARLMRDHHVGAVVVVATPSERPVAVGIITDRDIVSAQLDVAADLSSLRSADVMTPDPLVLCESDSVTDAIERLRVRGVRRAPVVTVHGTLVGLVSTDDLISQVARNLGTLARLLERQLATEAASEH
jgi:CBS domain-containing protein